MQLFTDWIMQILVFIVFATIVELLLPSNQMKKYVHLVLGLLLLLLLTKPILHVFSVDVTTITEQLDQSLFQNEEKLEQTKNDIDKQKKDIQATQDAYIWNEVTSQLKQEGNEVLKEKHAAEITELTIETNDENELLLVQCRVSMTAPSENNDAIEPIEIDIDDGKSKQSQQKQKNKIISSLADVWDIKTSQIEVQWEGGTS